MTTVKTRATVVLLLVLGSLRAAAAQPAPIDPAAPSACTPDAAEESRYRLRAGDALAVDFRFTPEFNQSVLVRPDGFVTLNGVGEIGVVGLTVKGVTCALTNAYSTFLREPVIDVVVSDFEKPSFIVTGEVEQPGKFELRSDITIVEAVAIAGGFKQSAKQTDVYLFRQRSAEGPETHVLDVKRMLAEGRLDSNLYIRADDVLYVPQTTLSKFERFLPVPGIGILLPR